MAFRLFAINREGYSETIAEVAYFAASAPEHMLIAEILVMPT